MTLYVVYGKTFMAFMKFIDEASCEAARVKFAEVSPGFMDISVCIAGLAG